MAVEEQRVDQGRIGPWTFFAGPAVVAAGDGDINFFEGILAHIVDVECAGGGIERELKRIAKTVGVNFAAGSADADKGIVSRDGAIGIDTQNLAEAIGEQLRIRGVSVFTDADIELAVGAEFDGAAVVIGSAGKGFQVEQLRFAGG